MGYLHINNLYKDQSILQFKECYALEKVHGTSAAVSIAKDGDLHIFSGGEKHERFARLFDQEVLKAALLAVTSEPITLYGEAYGGKQQGMSATYGPELRFVVFDVKIGDSWLSVPQAEEVTRQQCGLEFVHYRRINTDLGSIDAERDADSEQAIRNGVGPGKIREGVVLRPLQELTKNNGTRIIAKHKRDEFMETATPRKVAPGKLEVVANARLAALEWVTEMRLNHVLDKTPATGIEDTGKVIKAMLEDILREAEGELAVTNEMKSAINQRTAQLWKQRLYAQLEGSSGQEEA